MLNFGQTTEFHFKIHHSIFNIQNCVSHKPGRQALLLPDTPDGNSG